MVLLRLSADVATHIAKAIMITLNTFLIIVCIFFVIVLYLLQSNETKGYDFLQIYCILVVYPKIIRNFAPEKLRF